MRAACMRLMSVCLFLAFATAGISQYQIGMRQAFGSGVYSLPLNPSMAIHTSRKWDLQIVGAGATLLNDYAHIKNTNTWDLLSNAKSSSFITNEDLEETPVPSDTRVISFDDRRKSHYGSLSLTAEGPAIVYKVNEYWAIGAFSRWRFLGGIQNIPANATYDIYDNMPQGQPFSLEESRLGALHWIEMGVHGSHLRETSFGYFSFGLNLKALKVFDAAYMYMQNDIVATKYPGDSLFIENGMFRFGFTDDQRIGKPYSLNSNGGGFAMDLGFSWIVKGDQEHYNWRLGLSLLDIGQIGTSRVSEEHSFDLPVGYFVTPDLLDHETFSEMMHDLSSIVYGGAARSFRGKKLKMWLPAGVSIQLDKNISNNIHVYGVWMQRLPMPGAGIDRPNILHFGTRYEQDWFGGSISAQSVNFQSWRLGVSMRAGILTIGSEHLGSLVGRRDWYGTDLYFSVRLDSLLFKNTGRKYKSLKRSRVKCYQF